MPPRRSARGPSSSGAAAAAKTAPAPRAIDFDVDVDSGVAAFTPGRLSPSAYLERKEATTSAQLAR